MSFMSAQSEVSQSVPTARMAMARYAVEEEEWMRIHVDFAGPFEGHMFLVDYQDYPGFQEFFSAVMGCQKCWAVTTMCSSVQVISGLFSRRME